jgi:hypothetical protein
MDKELDGRGGHWYRLPSVIDPDDENVVNQWLQPFREARRVHPKFYAKLIQELLVEDYQKNCAYKQELTLA